MIKKTTEITLVTDPNIADLTLQGCQQIIEQLADEFELDKNTIETVKTFDRETTKGDASLSTRVVAKIIKYNNYWLGVSFFSYPDRSFLLKDMSTDVIRFGVTDNIDANGFSVYKGIRIVISLIKNKEDAFYENTSETQPYPYNSCYIDKTLNKTIFNFNLNYFKNEENNFLMIYSPSYKRLDSTIQTGLIYINDKEYLVKPNLILTPLSDEDDGDYSISPLYGTITGKFGNTFQKEGIVYTLVLPCYAASSTGTIVYLYSLVKGFYKAIGNFVTGQYYIINGAVYLCIAQSGEKSLLFNIQKTYEEIKGELKE